MKDADVNLTAIMEREGIEKVQRYKTFGKWSVLLDDGRLGTGATVGEALDNAKRPDAENVNRMAA